MGLYRLIRHCELHDDDERCPDDPVEHAEQTIATLADGRARSYAALKSGAVSFDEMDADQAAISVNSSVPQ